MRHFCALVRWGFVGCWHVSCLVVAAVGRRAWAWAWAGGGGRGGRSAAGGLNAAAGGGADRPLASPWILELGFARGRCGCAPLFGPKKNYPIRMEIGPLQRRCARCKKIKPRGWFRRHGLTSAGNEKRSSYCRECRKGDDSAHAGKRRGASGHHTSADVQRLFDRQRGQCALCGVSIYAGFHVDHRMPICRGGSNNPDNLQLLCARCNLRKGSKIS